ncbi:PAS domain S-box protein [Bacillus taeanensis]
MIGQSLMNFIHPDFRPIANKRIQRIEENKQSVERVEGKFIRIDGKVIYVDVISFPTTFNGKPAVQTIFLDITEKKKAKQSLVEKENQLRILLNAAPDFICFKDMEREDGLR